MNKADVQNLVSKLRFKITKSHRRLRNPRGPVGRLDALRNSVTALVKYERIEMHHPRADEVRGYAERLISDAIRHGDQHGPTMEMADFWITEKQYIHKLFKVLAPRFKDFPVSYTRMYKGPKSYPDATSLPRAVLELRGNPFPALKPEYNVNRNFIHNVPLAEAKKDYRREKYAALISESNKTGTDEVDKLAEQVSSIEIKKNNTENESQAAPESEDKVSNETEKKE